MIIQYVLSFRNLLAKLFKRKQKKLSIKSIAKRINHYFKSCRKVTYFFGRLFEFIENLRTVVLLDCII